MTIASATRLPTTAPLVKLKLFAPENAKRVRQGAADRKTPPITLDMDLTKRCNSRCPKCTFPDRTPIDLPIDLAKSILEQAADLGIRGITLTGGGEPTLHKNFIELLRHGHKLGLQIGLITNGLQFNEEMARQALPYLTWVRFSVDAGSPEVYQKTHGLGAQQFAAVWTNVKTTVSIRNALRDKLGLQTNVSLSYLVFGTEPDDFVKVANLAQAAGVDHIQFKPGQENKRFIQKKLALATRHLISLKANHPFRDQIAISRFGFNKIWNHTRCFGQQWTTAAGADGKLYICCENKYDPRFALGDLRAKTLRAIWESDERSNLLDRLNVQFSCFRGCKLFGLNTAIADSVRANGDLQSGVEYLIAENQDLHPSGPYHI